MRRVPGIRPLLTVSRRRHAIAREVDDEIRFHIQMRTEELMRHGRSREESESIAKREYGDLAAARDELTAIDRRRAGKLALREWLSSWLQDVRFALRGLRARPGFSITILITLALGVGANAAIFSVVDSMLFRPLPFAQPDRLVHLWERFETKVDSRSEASYPDYLDWRARNRVFSDLAGYNGASFVFGGTQPMMLVGARATANFFDVLGVHAALGRTFIAGEDDAGAPKVVLLTYGLWMREFAGDRNVVGHKISLNGAPATVVGVLPPDFQFARQQAAELWIPIDQSARTRAQRGNHWLNVVARLTPGVTLTQASGDLSGIMRDLAREYPPSNAGRDGQVVPLQQEFVGSVRPILLLVYGAVLVVMLIACVNVANLLLIRGTDRQREIAVRVALGAGKARLIRQLITESLVLAVIGGLLGLGVAKVGVKGLLSILPARQIRGMPALTTVGLDPKVIIYAIALSLAAGVIFGLIPALRLIRPASYDALRSGGRGMIGGASRLRDSLVVGEIALTVVLLSGAMLFGKSVVRLLSIDPGFHADHVVSATVVFPNNSYGNAADQVSAFARLTDQLRETPGVATAGLVTKLPLDFGNSLSFDVVGQPIPEAGKEPSASYRQVDADYFKTMGIPLLSGRVFGAGDDTHGPGTVVINRALAKAYLGDVDPVGQRFFIFGDTMRVVGVVGDVPIGGIEDRIPPTLYVSFARVPQVAASVVIRTSLSQGDAARAFRTAAASVDRAAAVAHVAAMTDVIAESPSVFMRRFPLYLLAAFALTALVLAVVGIYGVVSYSVAQRAREMGIRMALGATPSSLIGLVMRHGGWMAAAGIVAGVGGAVFAARFAEKLLYGVRASDPLTYLSVAALLAVVALAATLLPARRATRVDPAVTLRTE